MPPAYQHCTPRVVPTRFVGVGWILKQTKILIRSVVSLLFRFPINELRWQGEYTVESPTIHQVLFAPFSLISVYFILQGTVKELLFKTELFEAEYVLKCVPHVQHEHFSFFNQYYCLLSRVCRFFKSL